MLGQFLAHLGLRGADIAQWLACSVPAVQKWRRGEKASGDSRSNLASLLAACDLITEHYLVSEIASWFEMPLVRGIPVTRRLTCTRRIGLTWCLLSQRTRGPREPTIGV